MNTPTIRAHWFFFVAPLVLAADVQVVVSALGSIDYLVEAGLLFDLVVLLPCLYLLCYRRRGREAIIRAAAIACLGIWAALRLVPESERELLNYVAPLRYAGLAALIWLEAVVVIGIYRSVFKGRSIDQTLADAPKEIPLWATKLLAIEAGFWLRLWHFIKRVFGR